MEGREEDQKTWFLQSQISVGVTAPLAFHREKPEEEPETCECMCV